MEILQKVLLDVLTVVYEQLGCAILLSLMFMSLYLFSKKYGWKTIIISWKDAWKTDANFRRMFFLVFYVSMILLKTLRNRDIWVNPLSDVLGVWGFYNKIGAQTPEILENLVMFIPFTILLFWGYRNRILKNMKLRTILWKAAQISFLFSFGIELAQLLFRLGTFQLSDLFYNTLGGITGGILYYIGFKIHAHKMRSI